MISEHDSSQDQNHCKGSTEHDKMYKEHELQKSAQEFKDRMDQELSHVDMKPTEKNSAEEDKSNVEGILSVLTSGGEPKPL